MMSISEAVLYPLPIAPNDIAIMREEWLGSSSAIVLASLLAHDGADRVALAARDLGQHARAERAAELLRAAVRDADLSEPAL